MAVRPENNAQHFRYCCSIVVEFIIGVGRFRILGGGGGRGPKFRILGGPNGAKVPGGTWRRTDGDAT